MNQPGGAPSAESVEGAPSVKEAISAAIEGFSIYSLWDHGRHYGLPLAEPKNLKHPERFESPEYRASLGKALDGLRRLEENLDVATPGYYVTFDLLKVVKETRETLSNAPDSRYVADGGLASESGATWKKSEEMFARLHAILEGIKIGQQMANL